MITPKLAPRNMPHTLNRRGLLAAAGAVGASLVLAGCTTSSDATESSKPGGKVGDFYWLSHGAPGDQIHVIANSGATQAGKDFGAKVHVSFHNNDVAGQQEAFAAAIAAKPAGIATSIPQPGVMNDLIERATKAGIPVVTANQDDPTSARVAYVGADLKQVGVSWATYLVEKKLVKAGDSVWGPVEVAGASYQVLETTGIKSVFDAAGVKFEVFETGGDPAESITAMQTYLTAKGDSVNAVIGLGDMVMNNIRKVFDAVNWKAGKVPVVGWGNQSDTAQAVQAGYINAATWQYPDSQGYMPIVLLKMISDGLGAGYDIGTSAFYDKNTVAQYEKYLK